MALIVVLRAFVDDPLLKSSPPPSGDKNGWSQSRIQIFYGRSYSYMVGSGYEIGPQRLRSTEAQKTHDTFI